MDESSLKVVDIALSPGTEYQGCSRNWQGIPGIEVSPCGRLWATWYSGGTGEGPENYVLLVTSSDHGKTWSEPVAVIDPPGKVRAYDPTLWHDPAGRMWWFWNQSLGTEGYPTFDGRAGVWGAYTEESEAPQPRFSQPRRIANGIMMNKPTPLSSGIWSLPTAIWNREPYIDELASERFSNMTISADEGRTFQLSGSADVPNRVFDEHMIVELSDGRLWMLVRTDYGTGQSFSTDGGRTWSPGEDSGLGGPNSRIFIRRLRSGNILLINHADILPQEASRLTGAGKTWRSRSHLTAFLSNDEGRGWQGSLLLDERPSVSYPDGVEDETGLIRVIYDHNRYTDRGDAEILMASFREEDVLRGRCTTADANLRMPISILAAVREEKKHD